jgi:hypothetical protein
MSTKITRGARLHLLRVVDRIEKPTRLIRFGNVPRGSTSAQRSEFLRHVREMGPGCWYVFHAGAGFNLICPPSPPA